MPVLTRAPLRLTALTALVSAIAVFGLLRLVATGPWIWLSMLLILLVAVVGHLCRCLPVPRALVVLAQLIALGLLIVALRAHSTAVAGFLPGRGALRELVHQFSAGGTDMKREVAPAHDTLGITTIMLCIAGPFAVLLDALAVTYRRAVLTGLPLLTGYLIPATRVGGGLSWFAFATVAGGYLALVSADGRDRLGRWGRTIEHAGARATRQGSNPLNSPHGAMARRIIGVAIVAALVVPWFVPTLPGVVLGGGSGGGTGLGAGAGSGGSPISLSQTANLRASLTTTTAIPLLRYNTSAADPSGDYLRESVLNDFDGTQWSAGPGPADDVSDRAAIIPGLTDAGIAQTPVNSSVTVVGNFAFGNLPAPYPTVGVSSVPGATFDRDTLEIATHQDPGKSRIGFKYTVASVNVLPTASQLDDAPAVSSADDPDLAWYLKLPGNFPSTARTLARQLTQGDPTPYGKALALENFFQTSFAYSTSVPAGDGDNAITTFLTDRIGFCQQFAATMAAMARSLGIPAVVAIGFTAGSRQPDGSYLVTTHDAHAWPMLYFQGIGWLRFEPTPPSAPGRGKDPAYALPGADAQGVVKATASASASTGPRSTATGNGCGAQLARLDPGCRGLSGGAGSAAVRPFGSLGPLGAVIRWFHRWFLTGSAAVIAVKLLALALLLMATLPALARLVRRRSRRSVVRQAQRYLERAATTGTAQQPTPPTRSGRRVRRAERSELTDMASAAWAELRETAEDLGYRWPDSDTPREAASRLAAAADLGEPATAAIGRVTALTEQVRYSPAAEPGPETLRGIPGDLRIVRGALAGHADRSARLRAAILPNSSLNRLRERRDRTSVRAYRILGGARHSGGDADRKDPQVDA